MNIGSSNLMNSMNSMMNQMMIQPQINQIGIASLQQMNSPLMMQKQMM